MIGISHVNTPIAIRDRLSQCIDEIECTIRQGRAAGYIRENVIVSTCNRLEIYLASTSILETKHNIMACFAHCLELMTDDCRKYVYDLTGDLAVEHAMRVACGLDSIVLGETQILGQIRDAYLCAKESGFVGNLLDRMFQTVIHVGKRVHTELRMNDASLSIPYVAAISAKQWLSEVHGGESRALVLGSGEMGALMTRHLLSQGFSHVWMSNRTEGTGKCVAAQTGATYRPWSNFVDAVATVDVIVACTSSPNPILCKHDIQHGVSMRDFAPLLLLDLGLPRNVDESAASYENITLLDIDHFKDVVNQLLRDPTRYLKQRAGAMGALDAEDMANLLGVQAFLSDSKHEENANIQSDRPVSDAKVIPFLKRELA